MDYVDVLRSGTSANRVGGIVPELLFAPVADFAILQEIDESVINGDGSSREITTTHTFVALAGFVKVQLSLESLNKFMGDAVGESGNGGKELKIEGFTPGFSSALAEIFANIPYEDCICLVKYPSGQYFQLGDTDFPATVKGNFTTGGVGEDANGWSILAKAFNKGLTIYSGTVTLKP